MTPVDMIMLGLLLLYLIVRVEWLSHKQSQVNAKQLIQEAGSELKNQTDKIASDDARAAQLDAERRRLE